MKRPRSRARWTALTLASVIGVALPAAFAADAEGTYARLSGTVLLDNERVSVERFVIAPGEWTGRHTPHGNQLLVFIRGGVLTAKTSGRSVWWRDGRVVWQSAGAPADGGETNSGGTPVELMWVTLKAAPAGAAKGGAGADRHLNYPNIPGEDLLENEYLVVQRFTVGPGAWEGVHAHVPGMLYIHIHGGQWAARSKREPEHPYPEASPDGEVGWMDPIDIGAGHESGNVGKTPIDLSWVTLK